MKLKDILKPSAICSELRARDKKEVLMELAHVAAKAYPELSAPQVLEILLEREKLGSTGLGNSVAIPHGKVHGLSSIIVVFGRSHEGIDFQSHDNLPAHLFFVLLAPENVIGNHLQALARLSRLLKDAKTRNRFLDVKAENLYDLLITEDEKL